MRLRPSGLSVVLLALALTACGDARRAVYRPDADDAAKEDKKEPERPKAVDLGDVHAEVTALQVIHSLDLSAAQLEAMGEAAAKTAQKEPPRKELVASEKYRQAMADLRAALRAADDDKIQAAHAHLDAAREKDGEPDFDEIEITEAARKHAPELFDKLNARQVAFYLSGLGNGFPDPVERITEALAETRKLEDKEWRALRDDVSYQAAWLVAGLDAEKEGKTRERISRFLDDARDLTDQDFAERRPKLEKAARDLVGRLRSTDVIRHYLERVLAETLSNHRLAAAVKNRKK